ncbi:unnamed protein product [Polarella glacialis]|uniref:Uncharacterized protein n=1 Tax=Polarella glacialis TaxID=89957 RepID=A0A813E1C5_POLGL|nr:unnamed protein product [Polarella glacialis]
MMLRLLRNHAQYDVASALGLSSEIALQKQKLPGRAARPCAAGMPSAGPRQSVVAWALYGSGTASVTVNVTFVTQCDALNVKIMLSKGFFTPLRLQLSERSEPYVCSELPALQFEVASFSSFISLADQQAHCWRCWLWSPVQPLPLPAFRKHGRSVNVDEDPEWDTSFVRSSVRPPLSSPHHPGVLEDPSIFHPLSSDHESVPM